MPAKAREFEKVARKLGFYQKRHKGSHGQWVHPDGRGTTIPVHGDVDISGPTYYAMLKQLGLSEAEFRRLK